MLGRVFFLVLVLCSAASADEQLDKAEARARWREGVTAYNLGEFSRALDAFRTAYRKVPDPSFLWNLAQCQRQLGQYADAEKSYRAFLRESPSLTDDQRSDARRLVGEMERAQRAAKQPPTGMQPLPAAAQSAPQDRAVVRPWYRHPAGLALASLGVASVAVGVGLLVHASDLGADARRATQLGEHNRLGEEATTFRAVGWSAIGVAIGATASSAIVFGLARKRARAVRVAVSPTLTGPTSGGFFLTVGGVL